MREVLEKLRDGRSRSIEMLAAELGLTVEQVRRDIDFLERVGAIRRVETGSAGAPSCTGCSGCGSGSSTCAGCVPKGGFQNMGRLWEVV